jgi:SnoaL-like domain
MTNLAGEQAVRTLVARIAHTIDTRRWADLRALYADEVTTDYTSLFGGEVQRQSGDALIAGWRGLLSALDATQHLVGPIDVRLEGGAATAECHVRGYHVRRGAPGGDEWMVAGQWVICSAEQGKQWRVTAMTLRTFYETGNRRVLEAGGS